MALILGDDDERVTEAALSFIDEFEHSAETDGKGASTRWPITEEKARKRAEINARKRLLRKAGVYGDPNRARNAQTREIAFLREQLEKLTLDLQVLQHQQSQCSGVIVATNSSSSQIPSMWQKLAQRQRLRREEAEANNLRLRLSLERHRKIADDLCNLARKRALQLANEYEWIMDIGHLSHPNHHIVRALNFSAVSSEFLELFQHLAAAYQDMDTIFEGNGLASMGISLDDVHMRESTKDKYRYLEFFSNNVLPFELHATTEATWNYFRGVEKHLGYGNLYEKAAKDLDEPYTIIEDFTKELYANTARADIRIKQVIRRYVESNRDVVIRFYRAVPVEIKHKLLGKLTYYLQGYAVTMPAPSSTSECELSILQLCTLVFFDQAEVEAVCGAHTLRAFTDFLIAHTAQNTRAHREIIENTLADQAIARYMQDNMR